MCQGVQSLAPWVVEHPFHSWKLSLGGQALDQLEFVKFFAKCCLQLREGIPCLMPSAEELASRLQVIVFPK